MPNLVVFLAVGEEGEGAFAGAVHHLLVLGDGVQLVGDIRQVRGAMVLEGVLQVGQFCVEAEPVVPDLQLETAAFFEGEGDGAELVGEPREDRILGPDERAGAFAVWSRIGECLVAGEGEVGPGGGAVRGEKAVGAGVAEEIGAERVIQKDGTIESGGEDAVGGVGDRAGLRFEAAGAGFVDGDGVLRGLELGCAKVKTMCAEPGVGVDWARPRAAATVRARTARSGIEGNRMAKPRGPPGATTSGRDGYGRWRWRGRRQRRPAGVVRAGKAGGPP